MMNKQCRTKVFEGAQRLLQGRSGVCDPRIAQLLGISPGFTNDTIVGPDHGISYSSGPFDCAYREDRQTPVACDVAQAISEIPFTLAAQACDSARWNVAQDIERQFQSLKEFQPI